MDLKTLLDTPPWDWPGDAGDIFWRVLLDRQAKESDRLIAAELAGDFTVINDDLADALLMIANSANESEQLRSRAAISLGPALEQADTDGFEDPQDVPITEPMFRTIQESLEKLYLDNNTPKEARRRSLEASVRAPQVWHQAAIEQAYSGGDNEWMLTAVFSMRWVRGFDEQILLALKSSDPEIKYEAVVAAGNWGLDAAWSPIVQLLNDGLSPKPLLLAAIGAIGSIRANEAPEILVDLADSDDEEIAQAVVEALATDDIDLDEEDDEEDKWVN
jgi:HEAT repeats